MSTKKLPPGKFLCVCIPPGSKDRDIPSMESIAWLADSLSEAVKTIEVYIFGDDFIPDIDARFEIFNDELIPVGNQGEFEMMIDQAFERQGEEDWPFSEELKDHSAFRHEGSTILEDMDMPSVRTEERRQEPIAERKEEGRSVTFPEIKIEDRR